LNSSLYALTLVVEAVYSPDGGAHKVSVYSVYALTPSIYACCYALTLVVEAVYSVDGGALVVAAQYEEVLGVLNLVRQQQADGLQRLLAAVHLIFA
jgi:hypothetical protein